MHAKLGLFMPSNVKVIEDVDKFRYDVKDNRRLQQVAVHRVFRKTGKYIFQLGLVNFLEQIILNLFLMIYAFTREQALYNEAAKDHLLEQNVALPYLRTHVSPPSFPNDVCDDSRST